MKHVPEPLYGRQLLPGFDETRLIDEGDDQDAIRGAHATMAQIRRAISVISKLASEDLWEYDPGGSKTFPDGSGSDKHITRSGLDSAWEAHEKYEPGSDMPEPTRVNLTDDSSI